MATQTRVQLIRSAITLEWVTLVWMTVEAAVAIAAGIAAHSVSVTAFGLDSVIELVSGGVLMWRLQSEARQGSAFSNEIEHRAHQIGGTLLFALAAYVAVAATLSLYHRQGQDFSIPGAAITALAVIIMYPLGRAKLKLAGGLSSRALRADAVESLTCGYLSVAVLVGLIVQLAINAWWIDGLISLGIVAYLVKEGREAWGDEDCCD
jgi:divalent metal cation (Fe/Co/Zn/Cd) transporter